VKVKMAICTLISARQGGRGEVHKGKKGGGRLPGSLEEPDFPAGVRKEKEKREEDRKGGEVYHPLREVRPPRKEREKLLSCGSFSLLLPPARGRKKKKLKGEKGREGTEPVAHH